MEQLLARIGEIQSHVLPWEECGDREQRIRLRDMMITQKQVLSAMLFALEHPGQGVLETKNGVTQRRPARPIPTRDLWFERVWKADLARREESCK